jgi:hypothetical protein
MKYCIDCLHHIKQPHPRFPDQLPEDVCAKNLDPVTGEPLTESWQRKCSEQREDRYLTSLITGTCGKSARWFKPRPIVKRETIDYMGDDFCVLCGNLVEHCTCAEPVCTGCYNGVSHCTCNKPRDTWVTDLIP